MGSVPPLDRGMGGVGGTPMWMSHGFRRLKGPVKVVVGLHHLQDRGAATQSFAIRAACPHPNYDCETMENDLLLLQVGFVLAGGAAVGLGRVPEGRLVPGSTAGGASHCAEPGAISSPHLVALSHLGDVSAHPRVRHRLCRPPAPKAGG